MTIVVLSHYVSEYIMQEQITRTDGQIKSSGH